MVCWILILIQIPNLSLQDLTRSNGFQVILSTASASNIEVRIVIQYKMAYCTDGQAKIVFCLYMNTVSLI